MARRTGTAVTVTRLPEVLEEGVDTGGGSLMLGGLERTLNDLVAGIGGIMRAL